MALIILFVLGMLISIGLQQWSGRALISLIVPPVAFTGYILFNEFVLPPRGGGASMWPIALLFGIPIVLGGSLVGVLLGRLRKK